MKKKLVLTILAAMLALGGCSGASNPSSEDNALTGESIVAEQKETGEAGEKETAGTESSEGVESNAGAEDYGAQIKNEIAQIAQTAASLSNELVLVNELYDKYDEIKKNAPDQAGMNELSQWGAQVWKEEVASLLGRIQAKDASCYQDIASEYEKWKSYVPSMVEKMTASYEGGSIYPQMYSYNEAMRYKREAYVLASTLADLAKEMDFVFPDATRCGFYGDYAGNSYLIITEGMENDTYDILVHIDDEKILSGWGEVEDAPDNDTYLLFTTDDGSVKGYISHSTLEASLYVTETDYSVIGPEGSYSFSHKY